MEEKNLIYPEANDFASQEEYDKYISNSRKSCDKRGYHRVNSEPKNNQNMICYDCSFWFDKKSAKEKSIEYKVEPL
jgi:hypothetical protein